MKNIILVTILLLSTYSYAQQKAQFYMNRGIEYATTNKYEKGLLLMDKAIEEADKVNKVKFTYLKGFAYMTKKDTTNAKRLYGNLLKNPDAYFMYVKIQSMYKLATNETGIQNKTNNSGTEQTEDISYPESKDHISSKEQPFAIIERVPYFDSCASYKENSSRKACMNTYIKQHVSKYFDTALTNHLNLSGRIKIIAQFKIDHNGMIKDINSKSIHPFLAIETKRVLALLPQMNPGIYKNKPVTVVYALPIIFKV